MTDRTVTIKVPENASPATAPSGGLEPQRRTRRRSRRPGSSRRIDKRSMLTNKDRVEDVRDIMWQLEKDGEIVVHRVTDEHKPVTVKTLYGWDKRMPTTRLWHHKSCGQCGNIPGYPVSLLWLRTRWASSISTKPTRPPAPPGTTTARASAISRAWRPSSCATSIRPTCAGKVQGFDPGHYYPLVHCGTSFGNYKEVRGYLLHSAELRERVKKILGKLDRLVDGKLLIPEEVVHYSEWAHVMRGEIANHQEIDCRPDSRHHPSGLPCLQDGAGGRDLRRRHPRRQRVAVSTGLIESMGAR